MSGQRTDMHGVIEGVVLDALRLTNKSRPADRQLPVSPEAALFGDGSSLDSLGLVALVIDVEDGLREKGIAVDLASAQALSQKRSPFRTVGALVEYITSKAGNAQLS